jgi:hypothetical protein
MTPAVRQCSKLAIYSMESVGGGANQMGSWMASGAWRPPMTIIASGDDGAAIHRQFLSNCPRPSVVISGDIDRAEEMAP